MPWIPFVKNGFFGSRSWVPLVNGNGLTAGGVEPEPPAPVPTYTTVTGIAPLALIGAIQHDIRLLKQFGKCTQSTTPTPDAPVDIMTNNGALRMVDDELPAAYKRVLGFSMENNAYWEIPNFPLNGSDTLRFSFEATDACNVIGAYSGSASGNNYSLYVVSLTGNYLRYKNGAYNSIVDLNTRYDVEITPTGSSGMKVDSTWTEQTFTTPTNFCIGTTSLTASSAKFRGNLYGNIEVVGRAKFIPCERVSDNVLGYYDTVGGSFYEQASGFDGAVSLGYDGSHYQLSVVGTSETLTIRGENLLDPSTSNIAIREIYSQDGQQVSSQNNWRTGFIPIEGGKTYAFWGRKKSDNTISAYNRINWFDADGNNISLRPSYTVDTVTVGTAPSNAAFAGLSCAPNNSSAAITRATFDLFDWMFAEAAQEIPYEPYVQPQTVSVPMLLGVGDYKDEVEIIQGIKTGRVGIKVLTGYESYGKSGQSPTTVLSKCYTLVDKLGGGSVTDRFVYCTHLQSSHTLPAENARQGLALLGNNTGTAGGLETGYYVAFGVVEQYDTIGKFTDKLKADYAAGNPWILLYPLPAETTEQTQAHALHTSEGTNVVDVTANVSPVELEVEYANGYE